MTGHITSFLGHVVSSMNVRARRPLDSVVPWIAWAHPYPTEVNEPAVLKEASTTLDKTTLRPGRGVFL